MCGRFTLTANAQRLQDFFPLYEIPASVPRYNVAPTQQIMAVVQNEDNNPRASFLRWGLIPSWAKDKKISASLINARADTVAGKPAFRAAFKRRRCLILADGFYEWRKEVGPISNRTVEPGPLKSSPTKASKQPFHIRMKDNAPFAFAGLWEHWAGEEPAIDSCAIITTDANDVLRPLHDRMPVILAPNDYARWLDPKNSDPGVLDEMLRPYPCEPMMAVPVGSYVNNARNEGAECLLGA